MKDTLTIRLTGNVSLSDYAKALDGLRGMVVSLQEDLKIQSEIDWIIEDLDKGSAITVVRGVQKNKDTAFVPQDVEKVVSGVENIGRRIAGRKPVELPRATRHYAKRLFGVINGRIPSVIIETEEEDIEIDERPKLKKQITTTTTQIVASEFPSGVKGIEHGSVTGRIQSITNRQGLRFTLYESLQDRAVSCYLAVKEDMEEKMRNNWGKLATVEGIISRSKSTGQPTSVRNVVDIFPIHEMDSDGWKSAIGASPSKPGDLPSEHYIRVIRDAQ